MIPPTASLVKYDNPILVSKTGDKQKVKTASLDVNMFIHTHAPFAPISPQTKPLTGKQASSTMGVQTAGPTGPVPPAAKGKLPPVDSQKASQQTEEILNSILPPREWTEAGQLWVQSVSSTPATRLEVVKLQVRGKCLGQASHPSPLCARDCG